MPTMQEFQAQLDAAGVTDPTERNQRIAEAYRSGELTAIPIPEVAPKAAPPLSTGAQIVRDIGGIYTRYERARDPAEMAKEAWQKGFGEKRQRYGEFVHELETGTAAPGRIAREQAQAETPEAPPDLSPGEGAFPEQPPPGVQPGVQLPSVRYPSLEPLRAKLAEAGPLYQKLEGERKAEAEQYKSAVEKEAEAQKAGLLAQADVLDTRYRIAEDLEAQRQDREQERQRYVNQEMMKVQTAVDEIKASKIDPYRFYRHPDGSADYPKSIAAAIAVGLGALGSSLPSRYGGGQGGPNYALQIIDKAIERDIAAQRDDIANKRAGVGLQMNLLSHLRANMDSDRRVEDTARIIMREALNDKLIAAKMSSAAPEVTAQADVLIAQNNMAIGKIVGDLQVSAYNEGVKGEQLLYGAGMQRAGSQEKARAAMAKAARPVAFPGARIVEGPYVPTKQDFEKAKPMVAAWKEASNQLDELIRWRAQFGQEKLNRAQLAIANTKLQRLKSAMRKVDETGTRLDTGEIEMMGLDFRMGDIGFIKERLNAVKDSVRNKVSSRVEVHGFELADQPTPGARRRQ